MYVESTLDSTFVLHTLDLSRTENVEIFPQTSIDQTKACQYQFFQNLFIKTMYR